MSFNINIDDAIFKRAADLHLEMLMLEAVAQDRATEKAMEPIDRKKAAIEEWMRLHGKNDLFNVQPIGDTGSTTSGTIFRMTTKYLTKGFEPFYTDDPTDRREVTSLMAFATLSRTVDVLDIQNIDDAERDLCDRIVSSSEPFNIMPFPYTGDKIKDVADLIRSATIATTRAEMSIARKSRRGRGNVIITHPDTASLLMSKSNSRIVVRSWLPNNRILVMYKGATAIDGCAFYAPFLSTVDRIDEIDLEIVDVKKTAFYYEEVDKYTAWVQL